jgi:hypothetical protein
VAFIRLAPCARSIEARLACGEKSCFCDAAHIRPANELVFSCRNSVKENVKDMLRGNNVSNSMFAFVIENSKLIMVFLLIGTIIGLSSFGSRPYQDAMRE